MNDTSTSVLDVLRKTRERVATPDLWHKGSYMQIDEDPDTCAVCLAGAVNYVVCGHPTSMGCEQIEFAVRDAIAEQIDTTITIFNDDPDTTHNDILRVLDRAIAAEEARLALAEMVSA